jgi:hypothetical protein
MNQPGRGGEQRLVELPKFNGEVDDPHQWWRNFNEACEANNISLERRLQIAPTCLKGQAEVWRKTPGLVVQVWDAPSGTYEEMVSFRKQFFDYFSTAQHQQKWMNELRGRRMKEGETVDGFAGALIELYMKADPLGQYPESDKLQTFLNGLPTQIRMFTELAVPRSFREAWEQAKKVESTLRKDNPFNNEGLYHINTLVASQVTQLGQDVNTLAMEVRESRKCNLCNQSGHEAINCKQRSMNQWPNRQRSTPVGNCHRCNQSGHWAKDCPERRKAIKCYNCGKEGHVSNQCQWQPAAVMQRNQTLPQQGRSYPRKTNNNQQPRRVMINQEYYEEQQEPQYYTQYQPQPVYYQNLTPVQTPLQQQPSADAFGALTSAMHQLTSKIENLKG